MKILFLTSAPKNISPSQRFRFEQYIGLEDFRDITCTVKSFYSDSAWSVLHKNNYQLKKSVGILSGFLRRWLMILTVYKYDFVYIHREVTPIGPPIFEWIIAKIFKKKIIFDFDDSIWVKIASVANPKVASLKCSWKVANICKYSKTVSVGNDFLAEYARKYCKDVRIIPTVVNTDLYHNKIKNQEENNFTIGWTGTYTNLYNLQLIKNVIRELQKKYNFKFLIIANRDPMLEKVKYTYKKWELATEIEDLLQMHIGIMPLINSEVELGKCAFKAIQYMSLGIPPVVSPVGANKKVVIDGENGFWANDEKQWYDNLEKLITNHQLRTEMGTKARNRIIANYSVNANKDKFLQLFNN